MENFLKKRKREKELEKETMKDAETDSVNGWPAFCFSHIRYLRSPFEQYSITMYA
jgi:hypothetical protein